MTSSAFRPSACRWQVWMGSPGRPSRSLRISSILGGWRQVPLANSLVKALATSVTSSHPTIPTVTHSKAAAKEYSTEQKQTRTHAAVTGSKYLLNCHILYAKQAPSALYHAIFGFCLIYNTANITPLHSIRDAAIESLHCVAHAQVLSRAELLVSVCRAAGITHVTSQNGRMLCGPTVLAKLEQRTITSRAHHVI